MTREEKVQRLMVGIVRSTSADNLNGNESDPDIVLSFPSARPLAEALLDVIEASVGGPLPPGTYPTRDRMPKQPDGSVNWGGR